MSTNLTRLIELFADLNVLVIGDAMLDSYLEGSAGALCREAPVPVVALNSRVDTPGGAANTAVNVRSLGGRVALLSAIGDDLEAQLLRRELDMRGVDTTHLITQPGQRTIAKHRVVADSQILVRFDQGSVAALDRATEEELIDRLADLFPRCDAAIISDYDYGILTPRLIQAIADLQARTPRVLIADARRLTAYREVGLTAAKPNYTETLQLIDGRPAAEPGARAAQIAEHEQQLYEITGAQIVAVTLDSDGAVVLERGRPPYRTYARPARSSQATGAGDTFLGALGLALAAGASTPAAAELASAAATIVVGKAGTAACSAGELRAYIAVEGKYTTDLALLASRAELYRRQGRRIVFTNGCFDILHRGHITYLSRAKALGDILIVGVNSDAGVRRLKGAARPINTLEDRAEVLAALSCVDHLIPFDEPTPVELVRALRPDVFVKGGDYTRDRLPEAEVVEQQGGRVEILPYLQDRSTTNIIERIRESAAPAEAEKERAVGAAEAV